MGDIVHTHTHGTRYRGRNIGAAVQLEHVLRIACVDIHRER